MKLLNTKTYLIETFRTTRLKPQLITGKDRRTFVFSILGIGFYFINYSKSSN